MTTSALPRTHPRLLLVAAWLLLFAPVLYYGAESIQGARSTWASSNWPHVAGTIVRYEIRGRALCSRPVPYYAYVVSGKAYQSSARVPGIEECFRAEVASSMAASYPLGSSVRVYYDPQSPKEAVLLPGYMTRNAWWGVLVLPVFFFGWLYCGKLLLKSRPVAPSAA